MPFPERTVEPHLVNRLRGSDVSEKSFITPDGRRVRKPVLFSSLEEVCCHSLTSILYQLSDLSRHASDIFLGIQTQAGLISQRTSRIQVRLERLQLTARKFDAKTVKIRKFRGSVMYLLPFLMVGKTFVNKSVSNLTNI